MLAAEHITFRYGVCPVLFDVSITIQPGELSAIVGPNGAGKSTLRKILSGQWSIQEGEVKLDDRPLGEWTARDLAIRRAVLPQSPAMLYPFPVEQVILLGRAPHCGWMETPNDYRISKEVMASLKIEHLQKRDYSRLSGGEKQRVQLGRVLAQIWEPIESGNRYLLLDEPVNNLDLCHQQEVMQLGRQLANKGIGVCVILHDLNLCLQYADQVLILNEGKEARMGKPAEIITPEQIEEVFKVKAQLLTGPDGGSHFLAIRDNSPDNGAQGGT